MLFVTCFVNNRCRRTVKCLLTGPSQQGRERMYNNNTRNKYTMSNDNLAIYPGYQYRVDGQGYKVIEVYMYI